MGLDINFPRHPHAIISPDVRWYPGSDAIGEKGREKLLPPLVNKIRKEVYDWREAGYPNISEVSQSLLTYWFKTDHPNGFQYYFAQRESVESIIYLYEHENIRNPSELLKYDSSGVLVDSMFEETWLRLVVKQATGTGKTKVLSLLMAWCYFHKEFNEDSELSQNFLLLAPNTIVLDRLKDDIEGLSVFNNDPVLPPIGYEGRSWNFYPKVHIQDNIGSLSKSGNIFLTNIQRFVARAEKVDENSSMDYFLGDKPVTKTTDNKILVRDIVNNIDDIIVFNDEAHHIHDKKLAWFKTIETINNSLVQKGKKLPLQLDVTATPKNQKGEIFPHTISDYPLVEAIAQEVVKTPILPDEASRGKLEENTSAKFSERWRDYIDLGVTVWEQDYETHKKLGKKALLFVMVDDTKNCDDVKDYLEGNYPLLKGGTFVIHTNKEGRIDEGASSKSQKELLELRELANQVDSDDNNIKAVVSVLMLKEGWDVKNVTTVIGLRPYTAASNILPEQALGRGLRRMYFGEDQTEELNVIGTPAFMEFVESIKSEGVILEKRSMGKGSDPSGPTIIEIDKEKDLEKLDIEIPVLSPSIIRDYKNLEELNVQEFKFTPVELKEFSPEEQKNILLRDILDDEVRREVKIDSLHINATSIITFFTKSIMTELRLYGGQDILYGKLKQFLRDKLFGQTVNIEDSNVARNLSETDVRYLIRETFKKEINALTVVDTGTTEVQNYIKVSNQKTFSIPRAKEFLPAKKSIFNKIVGDSHFELRFAGFLDAAVDVNRFIKNYIQLGFKMEYVNYEGGISYYYPDFVIHLENGERFVVETKGAENLNDPRKIERLKNWCEDATRSTGKIYRHLYVRQEDWDSLGLIPNSFAEIITVFKDFEGKSKKLQKEK
jgi:type III restriction enzyme